MFSPTVPYNSLPAIPGADVLETPATLKKAIAANRVLAELKAAGDLVPNQVVLLRAILLQEAKASSEIESVVTTNDALYRAFEHNPEAADPHTREVIRYGSALWKGYEDLKAGRPLRPSMLISLAQTIKAAEIGVRGTEGCRVVHDKTLEVIYTPPVGKDVILGLLDQLCSYLSDETAGTDPLIKMAAAHYQFEAIHPFPDGNGRTGRVLNILYLIGSGLLRLPVLYLSWYIVRNKPRYYDLLRGVTERGEWEPWVLFMLDAVQVTAEMTRKMLADVRSAMNDAAQRARDQMGLGYSKELIELVFSQPYTRIGLLEEAGIAKRNAGSRYLRELECVGILRGTKVGREQLYYNASLVDAMTIRTASS